MLQTIWLVTLVFFSPYFYNNIYTKKALAKLTLNIKRAGPTSLRGLENQEDAADEASREQESNLEVQ